MNMTLNLTPRVSLLAGVLLALVAGCASLPRLEVGMLSFLPLDELL
jgi:type IV pilus biogenesis protein CpaD/CtpE